MIYQGNALEELRKLPSESVNMCITSPPYWALRDYGVEGQLGLEPTFQEYISKLCDIFDEVKRVLRKDGTCWVNMGDTYGTKSGSSFENDNLTGKNKEEVSKTTGINKANELRGTSPEMHKCLCQIPSRFSIEMTNRGWILRNEIIWFKPNCMPSSVKDRFTVDFEKIFFFSKNKKYWFETQYEESQGDGRMCGRNTTDTRETHGMGGGNKGIEAYMRRCHEEGVPTTRNKRTVWKITTKPFKGAHSAVYPPDLIETPIKAGCPKGGVVLDPFFGAGTTGIVAKQQGKDFIGIELNRGYIQIAEKRLNNTQKGLF